MGAVSSWRDTPTLLKPLVSFLNSRLIERGTIGFSSVEHSCNGSDGEGRPVRLSRSVRVNWVKALARIGRTVIVALAVLLVMSALVGGFAGHQPMVAAVVVGELMVVGLLVLATRAWRRRAV